MCGIVGFNWNDKNLVKRMMGKLVHRGPDDSGIFLDDHISLGHQRLSIIDLSRKGRQPIHNEDSSIQLIYNGEIYNFREIKEELEKKGHEFYSKTDAEVIIHAYEEYGENCVNLFNGMFAFVIWDCNQKKFFLARDKLGIKPLFYYFDEGKFIFASEIKAILEYHLKREIDLDALNAFFMLKYIPGPKTIFKNIFKLQPGHFMIFRNGKISTEQYWDITYNTERRAEDYYSKKILEIMKDSVKKRLMSDVPLGVLLSGGIDSSLITGLMSKLTEEVRTFSVGFETKDVHYDELRYAQEVSEIFETEHHEKILTSDEMIKTLPKVIEQMDEPIGDLASVPTYLISKVAKEKVKVVLGGEGGDELFGGYRYYIVNKFVPYYNLLPQGIKNFISKTTGKLPLSTRKKQLMKILSISSDIKRSLEWTAIFDDESRKNLFTKFVRNSIDLKSGYILKPYKEKIKNFENLNKVFYIDMKVRIPDELLIKVDRASMLASIEARVPYLDHRLVELSSKIPSSLKIKNFSTRHIQKKAALKILPKEIVYRKKHGFDLPTKEWFNHELKDYVDQTLENKDLYRYLDRRYVKKILERHRSGRENYNFQISALLCFGIWYGIYMGNV